VTCRHVTAANITIIKPKKTSLKCKDTSLPNDRQITTGGCSAITASTQRQRAILLHCCNSLGPKAFLTQACLWHGACLWIKKAKHEKQNTAC
jgi:hypothetical protein